MTAKNVRSEKKNAVKIKMKRKNCNWKKKVNYTIGKHGFSDYEYFSKKCGGVVIRVSEDKEQGHPGSNKVSVLGGDKYGGWILNTPKAFSNKKDVKKFVSNAKQKIEKGDYGKKVPFPL